MNAYLKIGLCAAMAVLWGGRASAGEAFVVVRISDMVREDTYQVMSSEECKQLQKQLALEERNFPKALAQVNDEWRKDEMNKTTPFPGGRLSPRKIIGQPETFASRDKADARVGQYEERESNKRAREQDKIGTKKKSAVEKQKEDRDMEKTLQARRAADLIVAKLAALTGTEVPAAGGKAEEKPGVKAEEKPGAKAEEKKVEEKPAAKKEAGAALNKAL